MNWGDIPHELRARAQWAMAGADKAPQWFDAAGTLRYVSSTDPMQWGAFEAVAEAAWHRHMNIGYMLHKDDPYTCIDLDVKDASNEPNPDKWTKAEDHERYRSIVDHMQSYTETSRSGKGVHIWVEGKIGRGVRRDGVEVYSQERFIICTGYRVNTFGIEPRQELLNGMVAQMRPIKDALSPPLEELEPTELDVDIIARGFDASNGDKFKALWLGEWEDLEYPSQSEADYALINMLAFYTESNSQVRRLFRESALGKRKKALRDDYINRSLTVIRRELEAQKMANLDGVRVAMDTMQAVHELTKQDQHSAPQFTFPPEPQPVPEPAVMYPGIAPEPQPEDIDWPPGFVGYLAQVIYQMSSRPVKEFSIASALAHVAGIVGRSWNISNTGLNIYIAVVARSATGKNIIHSSMTKLAKACSKKLPMYRNFIDGNNYVSAEGFEKSFRARPSSVHHIPEFGKLLRRMNNGRDPIMENYARSILGVYDVSGRNDSVGDIVRAKKEDSVAGVMGPVAFSLIGESTPEVFRNAVTQESIEDGLMSRFLVVEYKGDRVPMNEFPSKLPEEAVDWLVQLAQQATQMMNQDQVHDVEVQPEAELVARQFNILCDSQIVDEKLEAKRYVWNRAHLMVLKIAAILAVADNCFNPVVTKTHMDWAVYMLTRSIKVRLPDLRASNEPTDESREYQLKKCITEYLLRSPPKDEEFPHASGIVAYRYLAQKTHHLASFKRAPRGATAALKDTIASFISSGYLIKVSKSEAVELFSRSGDLYRVNLSKEEMVKILGDDEVAVPFINSPFNRGLPI